MEPLTQVLPKPALPILDRPLVAWAVDQAMAAGVARVAVNTWHLAERMEEELEQLRTPVRMAVSREHELMDTAGGLALARERGILGTDGPVLVVNGDCLYGLILDQLLESHVSHGDEVTLALLPHLNPERWARVNLDADGWVRAIHPPGAPAEGEVPLLYPGVMVVSRDALASLPVEPGGIPDRLWQPAMERGRLGGVVVTGHWREVGTPAAYLEAVLKRLGEQGWVSPDARVAAGATVGRCMIGAGAAVDDGAVVAESILAEGAIVGSGARIIRSVVLGDVDVRPGETVTGKFLAGSCRE